jgi:hypothetical protein
MCTSDKRLKDHIVPIEDPLEKILRIRGVEFDWNEKSLSPGKHSIGVTAQEVQKVFPTAVAEDRDGHLMVDYAVLVAPLIEAARELDKRNAVLEKENREMRHRLDRLEEAVFQSKKK